jgi:hypothetical protein
MNDAFPAGWLHDHGHSACQEGLNLQGDNHVLRRT